MVPGSLGGGSAVFAAMTTLAPSAAARRAMALPMPRLAPVMNRVLPLRSAMVLDASIRICRAARVSSAGFPPGRQRQPILPHLVAGAGSQGARGLERRGAWRHQLVDALGFLGGDGDVQGAQAVLELFHGARAEDRAVHGGMAQNPGVGELGQGDA